MAYNVFPVLQGWQWNNPKTPAWNTLSDKTAAGNEYRTALQQYPISQFDMSYGYLSATDKETLEGFFNQQQGKLIPFYFDAVNDDTITTAFGFGSGDGSTQTFTLMKPSGTGASEPIGGSGGTWGTSTGDNIVYNAGTAVAASAYNVTGNQITFTTAPVSGDVLTWQGSYYYLVRFGEDKLKFNQLANLMYEVKSMTLVVVW